MPRENQITKSPNPAFRFFEWKGGEVSYYDKEKKENIRLGKKFAFILLSELATVKGYNERLSTGVYANEVTDIQTEPLVVKYFKGNEVVASGFWSNIKERVTSKNVGGHFALSLYIAVKDAGKLRIANFTVQGASLGAWIEFRKAAGKEIYSKAVRITESKTGKHGSVTYEFPVFALADLTAESDDEAGILQKQLKEYHAEYAKRGKGAVPSSKEDIGEQPDTDDDSHPADEEPNGNADTSVADDDVPF